MGSDRPESQPSSVCSTCVILGSRNHLSGHLNCLNWTLDVMRIINTTWEILSTVPDAVGVQKRAAMIISRALVKFGLGYQE